MIKKGMCCQWDVILFDIYKCGDGILKKIFISLILLATFLIFALLFILPFCLLAWLMIATHTGDWLLW